MIGWCVLKTAIQAYKLYRVHTVNEHSLDIRKKKCTPILPKITLLEWKEFIIYKYESHKRTILLNYDTCKDIVRGTEGV